MTNQELSKVAQAAAYMDVLVNSGISGKGIVGKETEDFCINNVKRILDELLKEENKTQTITATPLYRSLDAIPTTGSHPELTTARNM